MISTGAAQGTTCSIVRDELALPRLHFVDRFKDERSLVSIAGRSSTTRNADPL